MKSSELKALRKQAGLTQDELAGLLGKHRMTIVRWEKGQARIDRTKALAIKAVIHDYMARLGKQTLVLAISLARLAAGAWS